MSRFDRYLLSQFMVLFGFFALILVLVYWVNRAVILFDQLIADGQSAIVVLEFTALTLPNVVRLVLPMAAFAASIYVTNRLSTESELVVMQATGFSGFRLARPVVVFGLIVAILMAALTHFLVPTSRAQLSERTGEIQENITARLLTEGTFLHPTRGITFYIGEITPLGELKSVFLTDKRNPAETITYTAKDALLVRSETGPKLVMFDGMAQTLQTSDQKLFTTRFAEFTFDVSNLVTTTKSKRAKLEEMSTAQLFTLGREAETAQKPGEIAEEFHGRFVQPLLCVVAALIGFCTLLLGGFSRFGVWRQILAAVFILIFIKLVEGAVTDTVRKSASLWMLLYLPVVIGFGLSWAMLFVAARPTLFKRAPRKVPAT
ncbi:LPS export ABC transporter permease LptF [Algirhabdus cladophorae]|uniref:LPS export ABC transporter permease LptF n=1 Tax=Algirhabdus cladophorae TaxID=3377108 RepID=UPI003B845531